MRPPSGLPPGVPPPPGTMPIMNPNVLSAPPSIMKPAQRMYQRDMERDRMEDDGRKSTATIEAKPQIKNVGGDVTRFMPTSLRIKRESRDTKGRLLRPSGEIILTLGDVSYDVSFVIVRLFVYSYVSKSPTQLMKNFDS